jgi:hypothetical protein
MRSGWRCFGVKLLAGIAGYAVGHFQTLHDTASAESFDFNFPSPPDPDATYVTLPKPGASYGCDPLAWAEVVDERLSHNASVWVRQTVPKLAIRVSNDGKKLLFMNAGDIGVGITDPFEYQITSNSNSYLMAERHDTLVVATIIFDRKTLKMVSTFNAQGMVGIKGESGLYQCH